MLSKKNIPFSFIEATLFLFATGSVCFWAILLVLSTLAFFLKQPLTIYHLWLSLFLSTTLLIYLAAKAVAKNRSLVFVISLSLILFFSALTIFASDNIYDLSFDGQAYHQEAIVQFSHNWNPVYTKLNGQATANLERWLNHYPKGVWIIETVIYKLTGNIESSKFMGLYAPLVALAFGLWSLWRVKMNRLFKFLIVSVLVINPVAIYQSLSFYVDGVLASLLLSLGFISFRLMIHKEKAVFWPYVLTLIVFVNLKLSALVFASIFVFVFVFILWTSDLLRFSLKTIKASVLGLLLGGLFVGYNPYITNFVLEGHPLYPTMGKRAIDYLPTNLPENFLKLPSPLRSTVSIVSESSLKRGQGQNAAIKNPFTINDNELESFRQTSVKSGGFGPLFGLIFIFSLLSLFLYLLSSSGKASRYILTGVLLSIIATSAMVSMGSVARFVPFLWWVPGIVSYALIQTKKWWMVLIAVLLVGLSFTNSAIVANAYYSYNLKESRFLQMKLEDLSRDQSGKQINLYVAQFGSVKLKLDKHNISYKEVPEEATCLSRARILPHNIAESCEIKP